MSDTVTGHTLKLVREEIEAPLRAEIGWLTAMIEDACQVFDHYDLPEHAFYYRRELKRRTLGDRK